MSKASEILKRIKDAKNYVKKKVKSFGDGAPKKKATSVTATKPKKKATSVTATKPKSTATSVTATKVQPRQLDFNKAKKSVVGIAGAGAGAGYLAGRNSGSKSATTKATTKSKAPIVTKKQLEDSGFTNLRDYLNNKKGLTRRDSKAPERTNNKPKSTTKSQDAKPNKSNAPKPDYSNKTKAKTSTLQKLFGASEEKRAMGRDQMNAARKSMGMKHGGSVGGTSMGKVRTAKPRNINGIAKRGLTRAKHR